MIWAEAGIWSGNRAWSLLLIVLTIVAHVCGLSLMAQSVVHIPGVVLGRRGYMFAFVVVMAGVAILATALHDLEAIAWALAYIALGALPDFRMAVLYSLDAITTYGHSDIALAPHWRLMGALEALNGMLLFGLTTASMFGVVQRVWPAGAASHVDVSALASHDT
ncbi:hypothetical protein [Limobrevibacterium gyesilva]|uniref:Two pore domain potassium channel family protein n=1 Tax=Limobrevibacterium gyesilva TaxID=2991712 RepID=A0AA41YJC8_9PROT|nr:hypothetical protein [Limobrevibacterium gyesilva]MCW3474779.1 hypothetical protein [Limobrevibacterium gyesilva]